MGCNLFFLVKLLIWIQDPPLQLPDVREKIIAVSRIRIPEVVELGSEAEGHQMLECSSLHKMRLKD